MVTASFKEGQKTAITTSLQKYDYGEVLRIKGLSLPRYVAVQFAVDGMSEALPSSIGETVEDVTDVLIPNSLLRSNIKPWNYNIMAYVYIVSGSSGKTEYTITIPVKWRPKTGDDQAADDDVAAVIGSAVEKMNTATTKAENAANQASATAEEIKADREKITENADNISSLKSDLDNQKTLQEIENHDGIALLDSENNVGGQFGSQEVWDNMPYNRKYGFGGFPYGKGVLPPFSRLAGIFEADMFSVRGGKGRWNGDDTGNFKHGGHVFEGWNKEEDVRLTAGIGLNNKDIGWLQVFHPATEDGTDGGSYYGIMKIGSDLDNQGIDFMPSVTKSHSILCLKVGNNLKPSEVHVQKLVDTGELAGWEYNSTDMIPYGAMYFDYDTNKVKVYTRTGWKTLKFEEE